MGFRPLADGERECMPLGGKCMIRLLSSRAGLGGTAGLAGFGATAGLAGGAPVALAELTGKEACLNTGLPAMTGEEGTGEELCLVRD